MDFKKFLPIILILSSVNLYAEKLTVGGPWGGINNRGNPITINDNEASDMSDVELSDFGMALYKRPGYMVFNGNIGISTHGIRGGTAFTAADGSEIYVFSNDRSLYKSTDLTTWTAFVTTDTSGSYYDFAQNQGSLWRATSNNDEILKYTGAAVTYYPSAPKGNQIEFLPDRGVISGTAANPNRINFSASADFTNYATGSLETDPFTEDVGVAGNSVTAIKSACGGLLIFSTGTISIWSGTNQYNGIIESITNNIGTRHPNTVIEKDGVVYFQGSDFDVYSYDCNKITKLSERVAVQSLGGLGSSAETRHFACFDHRDRLWVSVPDPLSSINNSDTFIYDMPNNAWLRYSFPAQACFSTPIGASTSHYFMFGGVSTGAVYGLINELGAGCTNDATTFGGGCSGGSAFTARWYSKMFTLGSPFTEDDYKSYSVIMNTPGTSTNFDFLYNQNSSGAYTTNTYTLGTGTIFTLINARFPSGTFGKSLRLRFQGSGDPAAYQIYAFEIEYTPRLWRVLP